VIGQATVKLCPAQNWLAFAALMCDKGQPSTCLRQSKNLVKNETASCIERIGQKKKLYYISYIFGGFLDDEP
jgi:hypothetical protein